MLDRSNLGDTQEHKRRVIHDGGVPPRIVAYLCDRRSLKERPELLFARLERGVCLCPLYRITNRPDQHIRCQLILGEGILRQIVLRSLPNSSPCELFIIESGEHDDRQVRGSFVDCFECDESLTVGQAEVE